MVLDGVHSFEYYFSLLKERYSETSPRVAAKTITSRAEDKRKIFFYLICLSVNGTSEVGATRFLGLYSLSH